MAKILSIQSSINGAQSVSRKLSSEIIQQLQVTYPGSTVTERDVANEPVPHLNAAEFMALRIAEADRTAIQTASIAFTEILVNELTEADIIVIAVPFYNFNIPSTLKSWLDHIAVPGKTFTYGNGGPKGLLKNKKIYLAAAIGGVYTNSPMQAMDNTDTYLKSFFSFLGVTDITVFKAEGMAIPDLREKMLNDILEAIDSFTY